MIPGYYWLGSLYDGDAVYPNGYRPERVFPTTPPFLTSIHTDLRTYNTALTGDTLPMDLLVRTCTRQDYRHPGVGTQGGIDEGNRAPAGVGGRGVGRG